MFSFHLKTRKFDVSRRVFLLPCLMFVFCAQVFAVTVPGRANPWLAGMPDGTDAGDDSRAPEDSPVLVVPVVPGTLLKFLASGVTGIDPNPSYLVGPDGGGPFNFFTKGIQFGISEVTMPESALAGVFLTSDRPDTSSAPTGLDFTSAVSRDYLIISPEVKQVFFIGDGLTSSGDQQVVVVPAGATRLFLGTMDCCQWSNNVGQLTVTVAAFSTSFTANPNVLWPPNNKLVPVAVSPIQADLLSCQITSVSSNELITTADYQITGALTVNLLAKRLGKGEGRVYTIDVSCLNNLGYQVTGNVTVTVPHDQGKKK